MVTLMTTRAIAERRGDCRVICGFVEVAIMITCVGVGDKSIRPNSTLCLHHRGNILAWESASHKAGNIYFDYSVAQALTCRGKFLFLSSLLCQCSYRNFSPDANLLYPPNKQLFVGVLLTTQPEYITGIEDVSEARTNAFGAMGMFVATLGLSLLGIMRTSSSAKDEMEVAEGYQLSGMNQSYGTSRYD